MVFSKRFALRNFQSVCNARKKRCVLGQNLTGHALKCTLYPNICYKTPENYTQIYAVRKLVTKLKRVGTFPRISPILQLGISGSPPHTRLVALREPHLCKTIVHFAVGKLAFKLTMPSHSCCEFDLRLG